MPDTVRETFDQLRQLLKWDINHMREFQQGGNYAIALLVAIGCEAIGLLLGRHDCSPSREREAVPGRPSRF
jgi:hypothetical protein